MKIIELILDEAQDLMGIEAISIVENPAIEEDFVALKSQEFKLAEIDKEKRILLGALLIPNKPIYRKNGEDEYYIYFTKDTVEKASQLYLKNGNQNNSTLEHKHNIEGLTLVESWIVEDEVHDKSRKYDLEVPVGTWMGAVKVNNEEVWNEYVKTGKVKGFSIEGYFADKMERPKEPINEDMSEQKADLLLSQIKSIVTGQKIELASIDELLKWRIGVKNFGDNVEIDEKELKSIKNSISVNNQNLEQELKRLIKGVNEVEKATKDLGINANSIPKYKEAVKMLQYGERQLKKGKQLEK